MANLEVLLSNQSGKSTKLELYDTFGPLNKWKATDKAALIPGDGDFTNQAGNVVPSVPNTWVLRALDIDRVQVNATGSGEFFDNDGTFPIGQFNWKILRYI